MSKQFVCWTGILGVTFFAVASILGGFQFDNYSPVSQYISESMAIDTPYVKSLRYFGYIPSGILLTFFSFSALKKFPESKCIKFGFWGLGIFYGMATVIVGIFPCDEGCNKEFIDPSMSQIIHNLTGFLTYVFVPVSIMLIGIGLRQLKYYNRLSNTAIVCGLICFSTIGLLFTDPATRYAGLYQRIIEGTFIIWIIAVSLYLKNSDQHNTNIGRNEENNR